MEGRLRSPGVKNTERFEHRLRKNKFRMEKAETLAELSDDYVFVNHGAIFTTGGGRRDPIDVWMEVTGRNVDIGIIDFPDPIFPGLADASREFEEWGRRLVIVPREEWSMLLPEIRGAQFVDWKKRIYFHTVRQKVFITDPAHIYSTRVDLPGMVWVELFSIEGNLVNNEFVTCTKSFTTFASLRQIPINQRVLQYASEIFREDNDPLRVTDPKRILSDPETRTYQIENSSFQIPWGIDTDG